MEESISQYKNIIIRKSFRFKNLRLSVDKSNKVILNIPFFCPARLVNAFLEKHRDWINKQQDKCANKLIFKDKMTLSILGQEVQIHHNPTIHGITRIQGDTLFVFGDEHFIHRRVSDFIKKQTALYIESKAKEQATRLGVKINRIAMKDTTSRWGSCSGKNNLNFCWRLGLAPLSVLDYIIAHEVAHLKEMNHGPKFWRIVSELNDNRASAEIWLRRYGSTLR